MLFLSKLRIDQKDLSLDEFWDLWEVAARTAQETIKAGGAVEALYKVAGQRRVIVINNVERLPQIKPRTRFEGSTRIQPSKQVCRPLPVA